MKTIYHFIAPLLVLITMAACAEIEVSENPQNSNNELLQELSITGKDFTFDGETRSTVTIGESGASFTWDEDDVIGIFPDKGDQVSFAMDEGAGTQTATFSGGGWALKSSAKYAAYFPHVYENRDLTAIPVSYVGQTQNGNGNTDHIGAYDFMAAGVSTPENGAVAFDMQHLGALVQLTITVPEPSTITKVVLSSSTKFTETGNIDLTAEIPAITADVQLNTLEIALDNVATSEANENVIIYFMTAPVDLSGSDLTATIHFADATTCEMKIAGKNLKAGKAYKLATEAKSSNDYIDEYGINHGPGVEIDGVVWAPVNCGYHATDYKYGKLYQWGRKYGQGYKGNFYGGPSIQTYSDATVPKKVAGPISLEIGQSKDKENYFYYNYNSSGPAFDWYTPQNDLLWNSGTEDNPVKTEYDPCPVGWRVPTNYETSGLSKNSSSLSTDENNQPGYWVSDKETALQVFFPASGERDKAGDADHRGRFGEYWSSESRGSNSSFFSFYNKMMQYTARANGYSVRCVQE